MLAAMPPAATSPIPVTRFTNPAIREAIRRHCQPASQVLRSHLLGLDEMTCIRYLLLECNSASCGRHHHEKQAPPGGSLSPWESARRRLTTRDIVQ